MSESELNRQIAQWMEKGFGDSFASFCAGVFASHQYPSENLAAARMHAFYLRMALEVLSDPETREKLFESEGDGDDRLEKVFSSTVTSSYRAALDSDRSFAELFVEAWCSAWANEA